MLGSSQWRLGLQSTQYISVLLRTNRVQVLTHPWPTLVSRYKRHGTPLNFEESCNG